MRLHLPGANLCQEYLKVILVTSLLVTSHMFTFHRNHSEASAKEPHCSPLQNRKVFLPFHSTQGHQLETCNSDRGSGQLTTAMILSMGG